MKCKSVMVWANLLLLTSCVAAQETASTSRTVSGTGSVMIKQMPTTMRMSIQFKETGKDLTDALKNLKDRRDAAKAQLVKLGAKGDSMREGVPANVADDPQAAQAMMMMANARPGGGKKKKASAPAKVTISAKMSCEWPLPAGSMDEVMLFAQDVKDKVQAADLAGQKEQKKTSAVEQEEMEEMEMFQRQYGGRSEAKPGEPSYVYLAKISADDQQKARTAAFKKARVQAGQLAVAAGSKLGKLRSLQSNSEGASYQMMAYGRYRNGGDEEESDDDDDADDEQLGKSPVCAKVTFAFMVHAAFEIEE